MINNAQYGKVLQYTIMLEKIREINSLVTSFMLTEIILHQLNYLVISLVSMLVSRNFWLLDERVRFSNFHTVHSLEVS